ncbi:MAG: J domain-containing protein [Pseudomonadota bacterium]
MTIRERLINLAKANLNALLEKAADYTDPRRRLSDLPDWVLEAELARRQTTRVEQGRVAEAKKRVDAPAAAASASSPSSGPSSGSSSGAGVAAGPSGASIPADRAAREREAREREARVRAAREARQRESSAKQTVPPPRSSTTGSAGTGVGTGGTTATGARAGHGDGRQAGARSAAARDSTARERSRQPGGGGTGGTGAGGGHGSRGGAGSTTGSTTGARRSALRQDPVLAKHYAVLELPYGADFETVKAAYRRLMRKYHPDLHGHSPEKLKAATEVSVALTQAYNELEKTLQGKSRR